MISVTIDGACAEDIQIELRKLLEGEHPSSALAAATVVQVSEPRVTAAQKKAAEKALKEAAEKAAAAAGTGQGISSGEERTDPAADAQDAKDEAADTAAQKIAAEPAKLTHDDVKNMMSGYVQAYGLDAAQDDGPAFIGVPKISLVPDTQADLAKAVLGIAKGLDKNPNKRELVGDGITAEKLAQMKGIVTVAQAVK